jgi:hypothetical protein
VISGLGVSGIVVVHKYTTAMLDDCIVPIVCVLVHVVFDRARVILTRFWPYYTYEVSPTVADYVGVHAFAIMPRGKNTVAP